MDEFLLATIAVLALGLGIFVVTSVRLELTHRRANKRN